MNEEDARMEAIIAMNLAHLRSISFGGWAGDDLDVPNMAFVYAALEYAMTDVKPKQRSYEEWCRFIAEAVDGLSIALLSYKNK